MEGCEKRKNSVYDVIVIEKSIPCTTIQCIPETASSRPQASPLVCSRGDVSFSHFLQPMRPYLLPQLGII